MGGRGSKFSLQGPNEIYVKLSNNQPQKITSPIWFLPNDEETKRKNEEVIKLKKRANIITFKSTDYMEEDFLKRNIKSINDHLELAKTRYKINYKYFINTDKKKHGFIKGAHIGDNTKAFTQVADNGGIMIIYNLAKFDTNNFIQTQKILNNEIKSGFKAHVPPNKRELYTTTHELGHAVQLSMYKKEFGKHEIDSDFMKYAAKERNYIVKLAKDKYNSTTNAVSLYAKENGAEWFAETYTSLMLNGAKTPLTKALDDYLIEKGRINYGR